MFGKKKKGGAAKAKDRSMSGSAHSAPGFFSAHIEKIVLGGISMMFGVMLFEGVGKTGYDAKRTPEQMSKDSGDILKQVRDDNHWDAIKDEPNRAVDPQIVKERIQEGKARVVEANYTLPPLELKTEIDITKRDDPVLRAPIKVMGHTFWASIVTVGDHTWQDPLRDLEDSPRLDAKKGSDRGRKGRGMDGAGGMGMDAGGGMVPGMEGNMPGMEGMGAAPQGPRKLFPMFDRGFQVFGNAMGAMGGMDGGMGMGMPGGGAMPGMDAGGMGTPGMDGSMGAMTEEAQKKALDLIGVINIPRQPPKRMVPTPKMFNIVLALVPHEELAAEYERKFKFSGGYSLRDQPTYRGFEVERLDVTDDPLRPIPEDEKGWVKLTDRIDQNRIMLGQKWKGPVPVNLQRPWINYPGLDPRIYGQYRLQEFADPLALDPYLAVVNPPVLVRDYRNVTKHPDVPWSWVAMRQRFEEGLVKFVEKEADEEAIPTNPNSAGMGMGGMPGMDGGMGMGMPGMDGGMGMGGMPGMDGGMGMGMPGMDGGMGMGMPGMDGGMGMGMDSGMGMAGMGAMGYSPTAGAAAIVPKYKMIRFYDPLDAADIGRVYRYRIAVIMDDPNYPDRDPYFPERDLPGPQPTDLMDHVIRRVSEVKFKDDQIIKADDAKFKSLALKDKLKYKRKKRSRLMSPWSEPSDLFRVDRPADVIVGEVQNARPTTIATAKGPVQILKEPKVKVVVNTLGGQGAIVPLVTDRLVGRGAVLNGEKKEVEIVNPLTKVVKTLKSPTKGGSIQVKSNATIADIRGAEPLLNSSGDDPLADMGEVLIVTGSGNVIVNNEWDDQFLYRMYTFADEKEAAKKAASGANGMSGMDGGMGMGMPGS